MRRVAVDFDVFVFGTSDIAGVAVSVGVPCEYGAQDRERFARTSWALEQGVVPFIQCADGLEHELLLRYIRRGIREFDWNTTNPNGILIGHGDDLF